MGYLNMYACVNIRYYETTKKIKDKILKENESLEYAYFCRRIVNVENCNEYTTHQYCNR